MKSIVYLYFLACFFCLTSCDENQKPKGEASTNKLSIENEGIKQNTGADTVSHLADISDLNLQKSLINKINEYSITDAKIVEYYFGQVDDLISDNIVTTAMYFKLDGEELHQINDKNCTSYLQISLQDNRFNLSIYDNKYIEEADFCNESATIYYFELDQAKNIVSIEQLKAG